MPAPLRLSFLGVTHPHAAAWADAARDDPETEVVAVYDHDADAATAFAATYGADRVARAGEALAAADAVVVDGRNDEAVPFATLAVEAGLPVFIEKTGARAAAELVGLAASAREAGVVTQMGYFMRYSDSVVATAEALASGELGRVGLARFHAAIPHQAWTSMAHWFADASNVVTPFMEAGCHLVDVVRLLLGEPDDVTATSVRWAGTTSPAEDALAATMRVGDTVVVIDFTAHEASPWNIAWGGELYGDAATRTFGVTPARTSVGTGDHVATVDAPVDLTDADAVRDRMAQENTELMRRGMRAFADAVRGRTPSPVDATSGARTLELIEDVLRAAATPGVRRRD
ncbi:oxidoreductase domain protein [Beutenbergia cavernae DSM 12333]|uniref:Oxidoreductase domain protein n=1 Tax=Beutenbergia cavernae (strain ATCC BAA-8 / DSM 12333 / CCUG 43141 / JCM 11478 / NBRC 16432 / NCIMB 13614 / HKI 0122) TaxID=471853 RepID=C5BYV8_BEUC1|nr:Gfo/Idh/MocA family oxidoreductase [Beutenbergia cavernae]ACQ79066.1 oxidoreductase domain protein [Beutenbergia cavernae DSM 12333]